MQSKFQLFRNYSNFRQIQCLFKSQFSILPIRQPSRPFVLQKFYCSLAPVGKNQQESNSNLDNDVHVVPMPCSDEYSKLENDALLVQKLLKAEASNSMDDIERTLDQCGLSLSEDLVLNVLRRYRADWKPAYAFFKWVSRTRNAGGYSPGPRAYNEILNILGRMRRFDELNQLLDEMSKRSGLINERAYKIVLHRYSAAHKVEEAIELFYRRKKFGLQLDLIAFQTLLLSLCRYKHVDAAEFLFLNKKNEFPPNIRTLNIILNGWCVLGSFPETKRFWNDIVISRFKPDRYTYGIFINSLTKAGKINTAVKLFQAMWEKGCNPDVVICNCIINGLCFKKRIPEALQILHEMNEKDCLPDVATYNSLIKHLCKNCRMEKVYELLDEMEKKGGSCLPNDRTYGYLLKSTKNPEEVTCILERMEKSGCKLTGDTYNLLLRLFIIWDHQERVRGIWDEMETNGLGPDQRSYTIMVHGLYDKGKMKAALNYFDEMTSKGMTPEPRTMLFVKAMNIKLKERENEAEDTGMRD